MIRNSGTQLFQYIIYNTGFGPLVESPALSATAPSTNGMRMDQKSRPSEKNIVIFSTESPTFGGTLADLTPFFTSMSSATAGVDLGLGRLRLQTGLKSVVENESCMGVEGVETKQ